MSWEDGPYANADFWNDRAGRLLVRFTCPGYVLHLEVTHNNGQRLSDDDMDEFEADVVELLMEWLIEGPDDLPNSCYYREDFKPQS